MKFRTFPLEITTALLVITSLIYTHLYAQPSIFVDPSDYEFEIPFRVTDSGVLDIANEGDSTLFVELDQQVAVERDAALNIVAWVRYTDIDQEWQNTQTCLQAIEADFEITEYSGDSEDDLAILLETADVLLVPEPEALALQELQRIGQRWENVLWEFAEAGGFIVVTDYAGGGAGFLSGATLLQIYGLERSNSNLACHTIGFNPLTTSVRNYTARSGNNRYTCDDESAFAVAVADQDNKNNITAKVIGDGGLVYIGLDYREYNREMIQLLVNAVMWCKGGSTWLSFDEFFSGRIVPFDSENLLFTIRSDLTAGPGEYLRNIVLHSNDPVNPRIEIPVRLFVTDWIPANLQAEPDEMFIVADPQRDTMSVLLLHNLSEGSFDANVRLLHQPVEWMSVNRSRVAIGPGLTDRLVVTFSPDRINELNYNEIQILFENPDPDTVKIPILYYTGNEFGMVHGIVRDSETSEPVAGADVSLSGLHRTTDLNGQFAFPRTPPTIFRLEVSHPDYLPLAGDSSEIIVDDTLSFDFRLSYTDLQSELLQGINVRSNRGILLRIEHNLTNAGNGIYSYNTRFIDLNPPRVLRPFYELLSQSTSGLVGANQLRSAVLVDGELWIDGSLGLNQAQRLYRLDLQGAPVDSIDQPASTPQGMWDLAWDGQYLYGTGSYELIGFDLAGDVHERIPSPIEHTRSIAYDPEDDIFWVNFASQTIYAINRDGEVIHSIDNPGMSISGMGWYYADKDSMPLWLFSQIDFDRAEIRKLNPFTGSTRYVLSIATEGLERSAGMEITYGYDPRYWTLSAQLTGGGGRTFIYHLGLRNDWLNIEPGLGQIAADGSREVALYIDTRGFREGDYNGLLIFEGLQRGGNDTVRTSIHINPTAIKDESSPTLPKQIGLDVYPNPFNHSARLTYSAPFGIPAFITIHDLQGRVLHTYDDYPQYGRQREIRIDGRNLASGLYFVKISVGNISYNKRIVLLK